MSNHLKISGKDLVRAMGQDPATYTIPDAPTPEEFLANPAVTVFYKNFEPDFLAYDPLRAWFGGCGAAYLRDWRKKHGHKLDRKAFDTWVQSAISGKRLGLGCDVLALGDSAERIRFAEALAFADPSPVPLAAELMRVHCSEGSLGWTPPTGEERLGAYRSEVEKIRARGNSTGHSLVTRGLPASYAAPAIEGVVRQVAQAAESSGLTFDLLVFEPILGPIDACHVSHLYVVGTAESVERAAAADCVDEARRRILEANGYTVRLYGETGAEKAMVGRIVQSLGWMRDQAAAHHTPILGRLSMR